MSLLSKVYKNPQLAAADPNVTTLVFKANNAVNDEGNAYIKMVPVPANSATIFQGFTTSNTRDPLFAPPVVTQEIIDNFLYSENEFSADNFNLNVPAASTLLVNFKNDCKSVVSVRFTGYNQTGGHGWVSYQPNPDYVPDVACADLLPLATAANVLDPAFQYSAFSVSPISYESTTIGGPIKTVGGNLLVQGYFPTNMTANEILIVEILWFSV